jgi:hypothetical protein
MNTGHQAAKSAPGQPYGQRQATEQALAQVPIPAAQTSTVSQAAGPGDLANTVAPDPIGDAQNAPFNPVNLFGPSQRPNTPVTHGLPTGPGAGPEALMPAPNPDAAHLTGLLPLLEVLASGPDSTYATRNFLRVLRASVGS